MKNKGYFNTAAFILITGFIVACGSGEGQSAADTSGEVTLDAEIAEFLALNQDEQEQKAHTLAAKAEREWMTISGLEAELGGPAIADAAYADVAAQFAADQVAAKPSVGILQPAAVRNIAASIEKPSAVAVVVAGAIEAVLLTGQQLEASTDAKPGQTTQQDFEHGQVAASLEKLTYDSSYEHTATDGSGLIAKLKSHYDISPCPDADGVFTIKAKIETSMTKSGGATGHSMTMDMSITGHVNDDAERVYEDIDARVEMADFTNGKGAYIDFDLKYAIGTSTRPSSGAVNRTGGQLTDAFVDDAYAMGKVMSQLIALRMIDSAEAAWKSGRCVALEPTTDPVQRTGLQPSTTVAITAAPRSKIDGGAVGGNVTASLSGEAAVAPNGTKVAADASFTYTAANTANMNGTVSLEARSKRGVAKADVAFDTTQDSWTGTTSWKDDAFSSSAEITWILASRENNVAMYTNTGTATIAYDDGTCSYPATSGAFVSGGVLFVDYNDTPPTYHGAAATGGWPVTMTCVYPDRTETYVIPFAALPVFGGTKGSEGVEAAGAVSADGLTIEGSDTDGVGGTFSWKFTRNP